MSELSDVIEFEKKKARRDATLEMSQIYSKRIEKLEELLVMALAYNPVSDVEWLFDIISNDKFAGQLNNLEEKKIKAREIVKGIK